MKQIVELIEGIEAMPNMVDAKQMVLLEKMFRGLKAEGAKESGFILQIERLIIF